MGRKRKHKKEHIPTLEPSKYNETGGGICPLCGREIPSEECSKHHLIPVVKGGKKEPTVILHRICHGKIHSMFTEKQLKDYYNTIERLKEHEDIRKFIKWVQRKSPDFYDSSRFTNDRRKK